MHTGEMFALATNIPSPRHLNGLCALIMCTRDERFYRVDQVAKLTCWLLQTSFLLLNSFKIASPTPPVRNFV